MLSTHRSRKLELFHFDGQFQILVVEFIALDLLLVRHLLILIIIFDAILPVDLALMDHLSGVVVHKLNKLRSYVFLIELDLLRIQYLFNELHMLWFLNLSQ